MKIGVCLGSVPDDELGRMGMEFIEENVRTFLVPRDGADAFKEAIASARATELPVEVATGFLPIRA